ncbi:MAG: restriction endonuclease subunit S [Deltaproteobacteria bacterium]|nr:restriction endonuclease subunit S [Deltaproteobacteria bacterium]MCL5892294.1 restriction endonuclease subunit S [Deltaproteobacteria bacterium]
MKPYPAYRDSGIEWLGKIPKHWKLKRLKYIFNFNTGWTPPTGNSEYFTGKNKWVNIGDLNEKFIYNTQNYISDRAIQESRIKLSPISVKENLGLSYLGRKQKSS